jgi:GTP:adenosylcobinamide-phosphate guanylyltransferase
VVLAGERPGGSAFSRELGLPAGVLAPVDGKPALRRVIEALGASECVRGGVVCGPSEAIFRAEPVLGEILEGSAFDWMPQQAGPSASALAGVGRLNRFPVLLTAGDHALLTPALVDDFCRRAAALDADAAIGVVPWDRVRTAFPDSRRTVWRFRQEAWCGSNLFALLSERGRAAPRFWQSVEADRKRPWRIARRIGLRPLLGYLLRQSDLDASLEALSKVMGCRLAKITVEEPRAAVDVDSVADRDLAEGLLRDDRRASKRG